MKKIKVSVIIPVYNAGVFLRECLDSVTNQSLKEIEIIIINDGSSDNSYSIIKEYATADTRIVAVNQENQGQGKVRNKAIKMANGEFICFVDNDDKIELNSLAYLYEESSKNNLDILEGKFQKISQHNVPGKMHPPEIKLTNSIVNGVEYIKHYRTRISTTLWDKLWKASFIKNNNILNGENMHGAEDVMFSIDAFLKATRVKNIDFLIYNHREHPNAASNNTDKKHVEGRIRMLGYLEKKNTEFVQKNHYDILKNEIVFHLVFTLRTIKRYPKNDSFRKKSALELNVYLKKYRLSILVSRDYSLKEKLLLMFSIHLYLFYYDLKRGVMFF